MSKDKIEDVLEPKSDNNTAKEHPDSKNKEEVTSEKQDKKSEKKDDKKSTSSETKKAEKKQEKPSNPSSKSDGSDDSKKSEVNTSTDKTEQTPEDKIKPDKTVEAKAEKYPKIILLNRPVPVFRGKSVNLTSMMFGGAVTLLAEPDKDGFSSVSFIRPGFGKVNGYIKLSREEMDKCKQLK